jgi:hypothetical protein
VLLSNRLQFLSNDEMRVVIEECAEVGRLLNGLMKSISRRA